MVEANSVFQNSGTHVRLRLAGTASLTFPESGSLLNDLATLSSTNGTISQAVVKLRKKNSADLVCLIEETGSDTNFCALAGPSIANAFSVIRRQSLVGTGLLPIALSINFGCQTDRDHATGPGAFPFAYGNTFYADDVLFGTIEASSGQRVPVFSNPNVLVFGTPTGVATNFSNSADNALAIDTAATLVGTFYGKLTKTSPPTAVSLLTPTNGSVLPVNGKIILEANVVGSKGGVKRVDYYDGLTWISSASGVAKYPALWSKASPGVHSLIAVATDKQGMTTVSAPMQILVGVTNDDFLNATELEGSYVSIPGSTEGATLEPGEQDWNSGAGSVWYSWTAPADGRVRLSVPDSLYGTFIGAFTGTAPSNLTNLGTDRAAIGWNTQMDFRVTAGTTYYIAVAGGPAAQFVLSLGFAVDPSDDDFANRTVLPSWGGTIVADNWAATHETNESSAYPPNQDGFFATGNTLWWTWTAPTNGEVSIEADCAFWGLLNVFTGDTFSNLEELNAPVGTNYHVSIGDTLQIRVDGFQGGAGSLRLSVFFTPSPPNDGFADATVFSGADGTLLGSNIGAGHEPGEPQLHAGIYGDHSIWWVWTAPASGHVTIGPETNSTYPFIEVYTGDVVSNLTSLAATSYGALGFDAIENTTYHIVADSYISWEGNFALDLITSTIAVTNPAPGVNFTIGDPIDLQVSTTELDGNGTVVNLFTNGVLFVSLPRTNSEFLWTNAALASYIVTAETMGNEGFEHVSKPLTVNVRPPNDDFTNSVVLSGLNVSTNGSNLNASTVPGEPSIGIDDDNASVWYSWTAPQAGLVTVTVTSPIPSHYQPMQVYTGDSVTNLTKVVAASYQDAASGPIYFTAQKGVTYHVDVSGEPWLGDTESEGPFSLSISLAPHPANDDFSNALQLTGESISYSGNNIGATKEAGEPNHAGDPGGASVWYYWIAPASGYVTLDATGWGSIDLAEYTGSDVTNLTPVPRYGNDYIGNEDEFMVTEGQKIWIAVDMGNGAMGHFTINLSLIPAPPNDFFTNSVVLTGTSYSTNGTLTGATTEPGEPHSGDASVWYSWTAPASGEAQFIATADGVLIFTGSVVSNLTSMGDDWFTYSNGPVSGLSFEAVAGTTYQIAVHGQPRPYTDFNLSFNLSPVPANDDFADRIRLTGYSAQSTSSNNFATVESGEPSVAGYSESSVWWSWTPPAAGNAAVTVNSETFFQEPFGIFTGTNLTQLTEVTNDWTWQGAAASEQFAVSAGTEYQILVESYYGMVGQIEVSVGLDTTALMADQLKSP